MGTATPSRTVLCAFLITGASSGILGNGASSMTVTQVSPSRVLHSVTVGRMKSASRVVSKGIEPNMMGPTPMGTSVGECSIAFNSSRALGALKRALMPTAAKPTPSRTKRKPFAPAKSFRSISRSVMCDNGNDVAFIGIATSLLRASIV